MVNDDINDTPATGDFSNVQKQVHYSALRQSQNPTDSSDILFVALAMKSLSTLNSLSSVINKCVNFYRYSSGNNNFSATKVGEIGVAGGYVDYSDVSIQMIFFRSKILYY